jgi:DNA modification methylase
MDLSKAVTFEGNLGLPIYGWFFYKEGFSKQLVDWLLEEFFPNKKNILILDPFCGSGTSLLVAKEKGFRAVGLDVLPIAFFASKVKTRNYDISELKKSHDLLKSINPHEIKKPGEKWLKKIFYGRTLNDLIFYKHEISKINDEKIRDFFLLALIITMGVVARVKKQGGSLRRVNKPMMPVKKIFLQKANKMINDLEKTRGNFSRIEPLVYKWDARQMDEVVDEKTVDFAIFSPPYMNKIEYTTVYKLENCLFFGEAQTRIRSYIGEAGNLENIASNEPLIINAYLKDMKKVFEKLAKVIKPKGIVAIVVAGACFPDRVYEVDGVFSQMLEDLGFEKIDVRTARYIQCHKHRSIKTGKVRESLLIFRKL